jgi:hypothetical protein
MEVYDSGTTADRCNVGSEQRIWVKLRYEYDKVIFDGPKGSVSVGGKIGTWDAAKGYWYINDSRSSIGKNDYISPSSFADNTYSISSLSGQTIKSVIWDRVNINTFRVSDNRINAGSTATFVVSGVYETDNAPWNGSFDLNDTATKSTVGEYEYRVAAITDNTHDLTAFIQTAPNAYAIFDKLRITLSTPHNRIDAGSTAAINMNVVRLYDNSVSIVHVTLNDTTTKTAVGKYDYTASSVSGDEYGITLLEANSLSIIFDKVEVTLTISGDRIDVGSAMSWDFSATYAYDGANAKQYLTTSLNDTTTKNQVGNYAFKAASAKDSQYNLTAFDTNIATCTWDRVQIILIMPQERVEAGTEAPLTLNGKYEYDGTTFTGDVILSEELMKTSIGRFNYTTKDIHDSLYNLKTFTSNTVNVTFDKIVTDLQTENMALGSIKPTIRLKYQFDDTPVIDAKVVIDGIEATNLSNGSYTTSISTWNPYVTYNIQIDELGFTTIRTSASVFALGNIAIIGSIIIVLTAAIIVAIKRHQRTRT